MIEAGSTILSFTAAREDDIRVLQIEPVSTYLHRIALDDELVGIVFIDLNDGTEQGMMRGVTMTPSLECIVNVMSDQSFRDTLANYLPTLSDCPPGEFPVYAQPYTICTSWDGDCLSNGKAYCDSLTELCWDSIDETWVRDLYQSCQQYCANNTSGLEYGACMTGCWLGHAALFGNTLDWYAQFGHIFGCLFAWAGCYSTFQVNCCSEWTTMPGGVICVPMPSHPNNWLF